MAFGVLEEVIFKPCFGMNVELTSVTSGPRLATEPASELQCLLDTPFSNVATQAS
jgi:hypothetical protein